MNGNIVHHAVYSKGIPKRYTTISKTKATGLGLPAAGGCYLGSIVPFGYRSGEHGQLTPHEAEQAAIREMMALRAEGKALRAIAEALQAKGFKISHEGVKGVLTAQSTTA
jgi:hypothetical protein